MRVLWRFRVLLLAGFILASGLAFISYVKVTPHGLQYRKAEQWTSTSSILVTQTGFPLGRTVLPTGNRFTNPSNLASAALLYSELATSDTVKALILRHGPIEGTYAAAPVTSSANGGFALPLIQITATATSPTAAERTASRASAALTAYIEQQETANAIPADQRIVLQPVVRPKQALLLQGRSKTRPVAAFVVIMLLFVILAFVLENLRPRIRAVELPRTEPAPNGSRLAGERVRDSA
jgi:hypothetical protein